MFWFHWNATTSALLLLAVALIVYAVIALFKKARRKVRKFHFASLFSGKALLIGTLLFGGNDEMEALLQSTPYSFQQALLSSDFEFDYKDKRLLFANDEALSGSIQLEDQTVRVFVSAQISAPKNLQTFYQVVTSLTPTTQEVSQIKELVNQKANRKLSFSHGYVELRGSTVEFMLERPVEGITSS